MLITMIKTKRTSPIEKSTILWVSAAYPISDTIAVVKNRTELKGSGGFTALPDTRLIAMASPMARPIPRTIAVTIPDLAAGICTLKIVWI